MRPVKIILFTLVAMIALGVVLLGASFLALSLWALIDSLTGFDLTNSFGGFGGTLLIVALFFLIPKKWLTWNRRYECHGSAVIDAPVEEVWSWLRIHERDDYFTSATKRVRAVPGTNDEFLMLFDDRLHDDETPEHVHIRIVDEIPNEYLAYYAMNAQDLPLFAKDHLMTEIMLSQEEDGVKVTYIESFKRLTLSAFLAFLFLNPARDAMTSLKAQIEGTENPSVLNRWVKGMGDDGAPPVEVNQAIWIGMATAIAVTTALTAGTIYWITHLVVQ